MIFNVFLDMMCFSSGSHIHHILKKASQINDRFNGEILENLMEVTSRIDFPHPGPLVLKKQSANKNQDFKCLFL